MITKMTISNILKDLGINPAQKGYAYLRMAIALTLKDPSIVHRVTTELYPTIAKEYGATNSKVERCMRAAITAAWDEPDSTVRESIFRNTVKVDKGTPVNSAFIATVADYLITVTEET